MALQTREQHIGREKATSNICTAQVLLAIMAAAFGVYHGPAGIRKIAEQVRGLTWALMSGLKLLGHEVLTEVFFDTIRVRPNKDAEEVMAYALAAGINLRDFGDGTLGIALDEVTKSIDINDLFAVFNDGAPPDFSACSVSESVSVPGLPAWAARQSPYMEHPVFKRYHSETEMLRYLHRLENKDLSLNTTMIPLGLAR